MDLLPDQVGATDGVVIEVTKRCADDLKGRGRLPKSEELLRTSRASYRRCLLPILDV